MGEMGIITSHSVRTISIMQQPGEGSTKCDPRDVGTRPPQRKGSVGDRHTENRGEWESFGSPKND